MNYIYAASVTIIVLFVILILKKEKKAWADYYLILVNVLIVCFLFADVWVNSDLSSASVIFQNAVPLLLFPVFTFYLLQFTNAKKKISHHWLLLFAPFLIFLFYSLIDHFVLKNYPFKEDLLEHFNAPHLGYQLIFKGSQLLFILILIQQIKRLKNFKNDLKRGFSTIETIDIQWLLHFSWIYLGSLVITFILFLSHNLGFIKTDINFVFAIIYGILTASVFYLNYQGIQHYTLSQVYPEEKQEDNLAHEKQETSADKTILSDHEKIIEKEILSMLVEQALYLDPKFSLVDLAEKTGQNRHTVSRIINAEENRSFYDLVNYYRVEHLKKLMSDPKNSQFTILSLGLESGFNSKASLNRIFKKFTGSTPKEYLQGLNLSE